MSLAACIPALLAEGKIRKADADKAERAYKRHYEALRGSMGDEAAAAEATTRALGELDYAAKLKKRQAGLGILAQQAMDRDLDAAVAKGIGPHRALSNMLRQVEIGTERLTNQAHDGMLGFIERHRRNKLGNPKDKTGLVDVVRELHGEATGNETAATFAKAIGDTFERLRLRFNRNGGDIGARADFGLPHRHDPLKVRSAGLEQWRADLLDGIAPEKMIDPETGGAFTPQRLDEFIAASWKNIKSNGLSEMSGSGGLASRMLANRRSDPRFFVFRDGKAWLDYAAKYGDGNPFEAIIAHVHGMSRDIAFMERFGPNPAASWKRGLTRADRIAEDSGTVHTGVINGTSAAQFHAERMWRYMNGDLTVPVLPEGDGWGPYLGRKALGGLHGTRDLLTSALLGSAQITSIVDLNTNIFARKMNGLVKVHPVYDALFGYLRQLNPLDGGHRREAVYLAAGARDATRTMAGLSRWFGETNGPRWTQVLADDVLRVTGMNKFFEGGRNAFVQDFYAQLGRERALSYDRLPEERRAFFERHGIAPEQWDAIRTAQPAQFRGVDYVDWHEIAKTDPAAADKMVDAVLREARSAVLETDAESQSVARWGRPGTLAGEFSANVLQFKSFPLALIMDQARRMAEINQRSGGGLRGGAMAAKYAVSFVAGMTLLGAISLQLKEIVKGKDMRTMDTPDFWFDAFVNGGGVGVIGDLIGSVTKDRVSGLANYLGGPVVSFGDDVAHTIGSFVKKDPETGGRGVHAGRESVRLARRYTPGTTIWYLRAAIDRMLWDELQQRVDPEFGDYADRLEQSAQKQGQEYWWRPGEDQPERAPKMGEAPK
jgi:hypothetical protein